MVINDAHFVPASILTAGLFTLASIPGQPTYIDLALWSLTGVSAIVVFLSLAKAGAFD